METLRVLSRLRTPNNQARTVLFLLLGSFSSSASGFLSSYDRAYQPPRSVYQFGVFFTESPKVPFHSFHHPFQGVGVSYQSPPYGTGSLGILENLIWAAVVFPLGFYVINSLINPFQENNEIQLEIKKQKSKHKKALKKLTQELQETRNALQALKDQKIVASETPDFLTTIKLKDLERKNQPSVSYDTPGDNDYETCSTQAGSKYGDEEGDFDGDFDLDEDTKTKKGPKALKKEGSFTELTELTD